MASHGALPIAFAVLLCSSFLLTQCTVVAASVSSLSSHEQEQEQEIRRLRSKVASLEDEVSGRKEETSQLESLVREKTAQIAALVGGLEVLQVRNRRVSLLLLVLRRSGRSFLPLSAVTFSVYAVDRIR